MLERVTALIELNASTSLPLCDICMNYNVEYVIKLFETLFNDILCMRIHRKPYGDHHTVYDTMRETAFEQSMVIYYIIT